MKKYLFIDDNNGFRVDYYPFETNANLTQEMATKLILQKAPAARRIGSIMHDLSSALKKNGYEINELTYLAGDDVLTVIRCVSGNY